jgi:metal-sulfur cluster biosynthetic enzyme
MLSQEAIQNALKAVKYPGFSRDIVSFGLVKEVSAASGAVNVTLQLTSPNPQAAQQIKTESERVLKSLSGVSHVHVEVKQPAAGQAAVALVEKLGGKIQEAAFLIELQFLNGRQRLAGLPIRSLIKY